MLHKLLVLVLCLLAATPQRICTCAAASASCTDPTCAPRSPAHPSDEECDCHGHSGDAAVHDADPVDDRAPTAPHQHPDHHDGDCPAVKPAPAWQTAESVSFEQPSPVALVHACSLDCFADRSLPHISESPPGRLPVYFLTHRLLI